MRSAQVRQRPDEAAVRLARASRFGVGVSAAVRGGRHEQHQIRSERYEHGRRPDRGADERGEPVFLINQRARATVVVGDSALGDLERRALHRYGLQAFRVGRGYDLGFVHRERDRPAPRLSIPVGLRVEIRERDRRNLRDVAACGADRLREHLDAVLDRAVGHLGGNLEVRGERLLLAQGGQPHALGVRRPADRHRQRDRVAHVHVGGRGLRCDVIRADQPAEILGPAFGGQVADRERQGVGPDHEAAEHLAVEEAVEERIVERPAPRRATPDRVVRRLERDRGSGQLERAASLGHEDLPETERGVRHAVVPSDAALEGDLILAQRRFVVLAPRLLHDLGGRDPERRVRQEGHRQIPVARSLTQIPRHGQFHGLPHVTGVFGERQSQLEVPGRRGFADLDRNRRRHVVLAGHVHADGGDHQLALRLGRQAPRIHKGSADEGLRASVDRDRLGGVVRLPAQKLRREPGQLTQVGFHHVVRAVRLDLVQERFPEIGLVLLGDRPNRDLFIGPYRRRHRQ